MLRVDLVIDFWTKKLSQFETRGCHSLTRTHATNRLSYLFSFFSTFFANCKARFRRSVRPLRFLVVCTASSPDHVAVIPSIHHMASDPSDTARQTRALSDWPYTSNRRFIDHKPSSGESTVRRTAVTALKTAEQKPNYGVAHGIKASDERCSCCCCWRDAVMKTLRVIYLFVIFYAHADAVQKYDE